MKKTLSLTSVLLLVAAVLAAQDAAKLEADAKRAFDTGRFQEAGDKYAKAAEAADSADRKSELHFQGAWAYFIGGSTKAARENLKAAFTERPNLDIVPDFYSPDFVRLAQAVKAEVAPAAPSADLAELKRMAREKLADGKADEALYDLKKAEASPDPQLHRLMADVYERLGRTADAEAERRKASDLERALVTAVPIGAAPPGSAASAGGAVTSVAPLLEAAEEALKKGDFKAAQVMASRALDVDPKSSEAHRLIADASLAQGRDEDAEREYTASAVLDSGNFRTELGLAHLAERQRKWNTAASHYRRALELNGKSVRAAVGLGRSMEQLKDTSAARIAYGRAIEIDASDPSARNDRGVFLFRSEETDRAIEDLSEAVRLSPDNAVFHENLGRAYRKKGMAKEAERELTEAARLAPNQAAAWATLGHLRAEQKRYEEAAAAYRSALDLDSTSEEAASGLAAALIDGGRLADAETALTKTLDGSPKAAALWNNLGVVRARRGAYAEAIDAFQKAIDLDGNFEAARANMARARELALLDRAAS